MRDLPVTDCQVPRPRQTYLAALSRPRGTAQAGGSARTIERLLRVLRPQDPHYKYIPGHCQLTRGVCAVPICQPSAYESVCHWR